MVFSHPDVLARIVGRTPLAHDDIAGLCELASEKLHTQTLAFRFASVLRATYSFLMCHFLSVFRLSNNIFNHDLGKILAMAVLNPVAFPALFLEDDHFVVLEVAEDFCIDLGPFYNRCAHFYLTVVIR